LPFLSVVLPSLDVVKVGQTLTLTVFYAKRVVDVLQVGAHCNFVLFKVLVEEADVVFDGCAGNVRASRKRPTIKRFQVVFELVPY